MEAVDPRSLREVLSVLRREYDLVVIDAGSHVTPAQATVVELADEVGSTERIIRTIAAAPPGTAWAVGTELNLVKRLAAQFPEQRIAFLEKNVCYCSTMNRIDLPHLVWALENLVAGQVVNQISVDPETEADALVALQRMLDLPGKSHRD